MSNEISKEKIENAMNLMTVMIVKELEKSCTKCENELLVTFLNSVQGKMLYDDSTKLWTTSPTEIALNVKV